MESRSLKIISMMVEQVVFLDSLSFLQFTLRYLPEAFRPGGHKIVVPPLLSYRGKLDYVGTIPDFYYGVDEVSGGERNSSRVTSGRSLNPSTIGACYNRTVRMTSRS